MEKLLYLVWLPDSATPADARRLLIDEVAAELLRLGALGLTVDVDDDHAQVPAPVPPRPGEAPVRGVVSLWLDAYDYRAPFEQVLRSATTRLAGYQVIESLYRDYGGNRWSSPRDWPDGTRSPGILTVTLIEQKRGMPFEDWIRFWHDEMSPFSESVQPRCRYVRNSVFRAVTADAPPYRGIVEEAWPSVDDLTDPMRFYCAGGDPEVLQRNTAAMMRHVSSYIDFDTLRSCTMSEWIMRVPGGDRRSR